MEQQKEKEARIEAAALTKMHRTLEKRMAHEQVDNERREADDDAAWVAKEQEEEAMGMASGLQGSWAQSSDTVTQLFLTPTKTDQGFITPTKDTGKAPMVRGSRGASGRGGKSFSTAQVQERIAKANHMPPFDLSNFADKKAGMRAIGPPPGFSEIAGKGSKLDSLGMGGHKRYVTYLGFFGKGLLAADGQVPIKQQPYQFQENGACTRLPPACHQLATRRDWKRLEEIGRDWQRLAEIGRITTEYRG